MKKTGIIAIVLALAVLGGCIHKTQGTVTPMEKVATYNAAFADLNNSIEKGTEAVVASSLLSKAQAAPIILWTAQVATAHEQITAIIASGSVTTANFASIQGLMAQIKSSGQTLIASGALGVKNPQSQQTIAEDFNALFDLGDTVVSLLSGLKGAN